MINDIELCQTAEGNLSDITFKMVDQIFWNQGAVFTDSLCTHLSQKL